MLTIERTPAIDHGMIPPVRDSSHPTTPPSDGPSTAAEWLDRHDTLGHYERVGYVGLGENYNRWIYRLRRRHFLALARRHGLKADDRVLDVGLGSAFYIGLYKELGIRDVCGVDISPTAVDRARAEFPAYRFAVCDITCGLPDEVAPLPADGITSRHDWVSAMDMLYHIVEDELFFEALRHCGRTVRPGGRLIVSDNYPDRKLPADTHQAYHTLEEYEQTLAPLGFSLTEVCPVFYFSNGQVGSAGASYRLMSLYWRTFSRVLSKVVRTWRPAGETLGAMSGCILTGVDSVLQQQRSWMGYSTRTAVFTRRES